MPGFKCRGKFFTGYNTSMDTLTDTLAQQIVDFIENGAGGDAEFERLALALFARQYALCAPYKRLCAGQGASPDTVQQWQGIPAVPAAAFKVFDLSCVPTDKTAAVFHSSGTTGAQTSRHYFDRDALALYERSLRAGFYAALPERPRQTWALMPPPSDAPHSSLSHMLGALGAARYFWDNDARAVVGLAWFD